VRVTRKAVWQAASTKATEMQLCQLSAAWKIWVNSREEAAASAMGTGFCARSRKDDLFAVYDRETSPQRDAILGRQRIPRMNRNTLF